MTAKKPVKLKVLSNTVQKCREPKENKPDFEPLDDIPDAPDFLCAKGIAEFNRLGKILTAQKLMTDACIMPLAVLCALHVKITDQFRIQQMPTASQITQYRLLCVEFGLTPVSQGKINIGATDDKKANKFAQNGQKPVKVG